MGNQRKPNILLDDPIYTLAQSGTNNSNSTPFIPNIKVFGNGVDRSNTKALKGKAKRKFMTQYLTRCLAQVATERGDYKMTKKYWNTWHCQQVLIATDDRTYGGYCKNRWCLVCLANRKAELINKYYPTLCKWEDPHFVTLTIKSVPAHKLEKWIRFGMVRGFKIILDRCKKRHQRGKGIKLIGVKSLECNYNPVKKTYNPHFHIIVPNEAIALVLKEEWLKLWTEEHTYHKAQHIRKVGNLERDLVEIIKYGSKIFTEPDMKKKGKSKIPPMIYAAALDNIFCAMRGRRLFDRFGFNLDKKVRKKPKSQIVVDYQQISYDPVVYDWLDYDTGEVLTGFRPSGRLKWLISKNIDLNAV